jgi:2,5-diketo-D-gluconate reductase B
VNPKLFTNGFPSIGYGCYGSIPVTEQNIRDALAAGYRCFDCAFSYKNMAGVTKVLRESGIPRSELFIIGKGDTIDELEYQRTTVGQGYLDAAIIHSAGGMEFLKLKQLWTYLSASPTKFRKIGVSNMYSNYLTRFKKYIKDNGLRKIDVIENEVKPGVPDLDLITECQTEDIHVIAYSTLKSNLNKELETLLVKYDIKDSSWADLSLRWAVQQGLTVIPASRDTARMTANLSIVGKPLLPAALLDEINTLEGSRTNISSGFKGLNERGFAGLSVEEQIEKLLELSYE